MVVIEWFAKIIGLLADLPEVPVIASALAILCMVGFAAANAFRERYAVVRRDAYFIVPRHDPEFAISGDMSPMDMDYGIQILTHYASRIAPTVIFSINRGGMRVGSEIAMRLGMRPPFGLYINFDRRRGTVEDQGPKTLPKGARILLCDDTYFTGDHMRAAYKHLEKKYPGVPIHRVVLLERVCERRGLERRAFRESVDASAFYTYDDTTRLPWHVDLPVVPRAVPVPAARRSDPRD